MIGLNCTSSIKLVISVVLLSVSAFAEESIQVGVAANYIQTFQELSSAFEKRTGIRVAAAFASSGNLYAQIKNGAPYDVFLSADNERPARLYRDGLAEKPFTYATGRIILWSAQKNSCNAEEWTRALMDKHIKKIVMPNPEISPYGLSAMKALQISGLYDALKQKLVNSQDIAQAFQYASTGAVSAGFCALSAAFSEKGRAGCYYRVKEAPPILQSACILKSSDNIKGAEKFAAFLSSKEAAEINKKYGYR